MSDQNRLKRSIFFILCLALVALGCASLFLRAGVPQVEGTIGGLPVQAPVEVIRDGYGIPHIFARDDHDLMVAIGYVHAQDRLWQMEMFRRMSVGRLAEVAGPSMLELDHWARLIGLPRMRADLAARIDDREKALAAAYLEGINTYLARNKNDLPLEFQKLGFVPEPWTVEDLYSVAVVNSWFLETDFTQEWVALAGRKHIGLAELRDVLPSYPDARLPDDDYFEQLRSCKIGKLLPAMEAMFVALSSTNGQGSNNWVVARGDDGKPLLSNDPHLALMVPGVWYFCHLVTSEYQVAGASMPGIPGIILGHNDHIAWGWTNVMADMTDLYVFRLDPQDHHRYLVGDRSIEFQQEQQTYRLPGGQTETRTIYGTIRGPLITDLCDDCDAVVALKWYGSMPADEIDDKSGLALLELDRAHNVEEAFRAVSFFKIQSQNLVVADVQGNIGWHVFGAIPNRRGYSGRLPADGSSGEMDWTGFVPFDQLPSTINPARGWIATANNRTVGDDVPHPLSYAWCPPYRYERIAQMLAGLNRPTPDDFRAMQTDVRSLQAERIIPKLATYSFGDARARRAVEMMSAWDRNVTADSAGAAVYEVFVTEWVRALFSDKLKDDLRWYFRLLAAAYIAPDVLLDRPESPLWDRVDTPEKETPRQILELSLINTIKELEKRLGLDPASWQWGRVHRYFFAHPGARNGLEHRLLSRGPFPAPGDNGTVNAAVFDPSLDSYDAIVIPSLRMIAPLGDLNRATIVGPIGQSGQPGLPHYDDLIEPWLSGRGVPLLFSRESIERAAESRLTLAP